MSITLDTVTLPSGLIWTDEYATTPILQSVRTRLDGGLAVYPRTLLNGREITLTATEDHWLTRAQADALTALAAVSGATYSLTLRNVIYSVIFRHHDPPALDLRILADWDDAASADPVIGSIKLITV